MAENIADFETTLNLGQNSAFIMTGDVNIHVNLSGSASIAAAPKPTFIDTVDRLTPRFVESQDYLQVKQQQEGKTVSVLHLHGMPGSGKSQIVRKLGRDFSQICEEPLVKWHIECSDRNHNIKIKLKELVTSMVKNSFLQLNEGVVDTALEAMMGDRCQQLVNLLVLCNHPILIIVEDPKQEDWEFFNNFLSCILGVKEREAKMHIYVTSQSKQTCDTFRSCKFSMQNIKGLVVSEGLAFLDLPENSSEMEKQAASKIIERLSGSPLGLLAVKASKPRSYQAYLRNVENESKAQAMYQIELKKIKDRKRSQRHLYDAILFLLKNNSQERNAQRRWKAICTLSMFHHGNIPQILVRRVMHYLREEEVNIDTCALYNDNEAKDFIENCMNYGVCNEIGQNVESGEEGNISFHEVVFRAVRIGQGLEYESHYRLAVKALASIVHKDMRKQADSLFLTNMCPHISSVLKRQTENSNDIFLQLCKAHLHEVIGMVLGTQQNPDEEVSESELNLREALQIWTAVTTDLTANTIIQPATDSSADERAKFIVDQLIDAGKKIFTEDLDIEAYLSIVVHPKSEELQHYADLSNPDVANYFKTALEDKIPLDPVKLRQYRSNRTQLFLDKDRLCAIYLVERIASILHTMSRLLLHYGDKVTPECRLRFQWFSTLCLAICNEVRQRFDIAPIFLRINAGASVNIRLKGLRNFTQSERYNILMETKKFVEDKLLNSHSREANFCEHGIIMHVNTAEYDSLTHKRSLVRINAKLTPIAEEDFDPILSDEICWDLHERASASIGDWGILTRCIVYCGKYWAARGEYLRAVEHFEEALQRETDRSPAEKSRSLPWVCYNHARAVVCGRLLDRAEASKVRCEEALEHRAKMEKGLATKVIEVIRQLDQLLHSSA